MLVKVWKIDLAKLREFKQILQKDRKSKVNIKWYVYDRTVDLNLTDEELLGFITISEDLVSMLADPEHSVDLNYFKAESRKDAELVRSRSSWVYFDKTLEGKLGEKLRIITPVEYDAPRTFWNYNHELSGFYIKDADNIHSSYMYYLYINRDELNDNPSDIYLPKENYHEFVQLSREIKHVVSNEEGEKMNNHLNDLLVVNKSRRDKYTFTLGRQTVNFNSKDFIQGIKTYYDFVGLPDVLYGSVMTNNGERVKLTVDGMNVNLI